MQGNSFTGMVNGPKGTIIRLDLIVILLYRDTVRNHVTSLHVTRP